jgi:hypothetical protein
MKRVTRFDKTKCARWQANQFRQFLHVGAYWLLHMLRQAAPKRSRWRGPTFETIRRMFAKVAVRVEELKRRIKLAFPASTPQAAMLALIAGAINQGRTLTGAAAAARALPRQSRTRSRTSRHADPDHRPTAHAATSSASRS